jgi:pilus assembly protein CpaE
MAAGAPQPTSSERAHTDRRPVDWDVFISPQEPPRMTADRSSRPPPAAEGSAQVITVYSPKGGVGTTTIAVNLAVHAAAAAQTRVVLIDLRLPYGHTVTHLGLRAGPSVFDAVLALRRKGPPEVLAAYTRVHESGLFVLPAPESLASSSRLTATDIELLLAAAAAWFGVVVIDAGPSLDDRTTAALAAATTLVVPVVCGF